MSAVSHRQSQHSLTRFLVAALMFAGLALTTTRTEAAELIPSLGMTKTPESGEGTKISYGLAVRAGIVPMVSAEIGLGYRKEKLQSGDLESTQWPVTGSVWVKAMPLVYMGGGVGWYNTTLHYPNTPALLSKTSQQFGIHLGGGVNVPLLPGVASIDLNGRYVYLGDQQSDLPPNSFNADYWTTSLGVAIGF